MEVRRLQVPDSPSRRFDHGEVLVRQGERSAWLDLVREGAVALTSVLPSGRAVVVGLLGAGDLFGEAALAGSDASPVEARAVGAATVSALPVEGPTRSWRATRRPRWRSSGC
ncbi:MAG TPA: cyclic nucleotide-binding domain-containing protein [Actinomycetota bacterium]|nr:cyclic nucleotide-binding domain-containing protein [Actinomycetota bacterium]